MRIIHIEGNMRRTEIAKVSSYAEARSYLEKIGKIVVFDLDTFAGGADALVIHHGGTIADQYAISI